MARKTAPAKIDCFTKVVTPENIQFEYVLAGPFLRLPAYLLDVAFWNMFFFGVLILLGVVGSFLGFAGVSAAGPLIVFLMFVAYFLISWFYGIFFEVYFNGRTPGKMLLKLRVIGVDGRPINALQAGLRNFLRVADVNVMLSVQMFSNEAPPMYVFPTMTVGLAAMMLTRRMQRVGDLAAGTMVIYEQPTYSPWNLQPDDIRAFGLAELIPPTFAVSSSLAQAIGLYMENRQRLGIARREEVAAKIAGPLISKFGLQPSTGNDLLLCALYVRVFMSEQQQLEGLNALRSSNQRPNPISPTVPPTVATTPWNDVWPQPGSVQSAPSSSSHPSLNHSEFQ